MTIHYGPDCGTLGYHRARRVRAEQDRQHEILLLQHDVEILKFKVRMLEQQAAPVEICHEMEGG